MNIRTIILFSITAGKDTVVKNEKVPDTNGKENWKLIESEVISLRKGINQLRIVMHTGDLYFKSIHLDKK